jgi:uncharacterized protein (TIGR02271 family)
MQRELTLDRLADMRGTAVYAEDGDRIGNVEEIYYDEDTRQPEWIGIGVGFLGMRRVVVPVQGASTTDDGITVPYAKDQVKDAPGIDGDEIGESTERDLYSHYGLQASESRSDSLLADGTAGTATGGGMAGEDFDRDASVTRSEEELRVGTRAVETGRVRLRKWVETEPVEADVELRQETVHVERRPIDQEVQAGTIGEDEVEVRLTGEEAVVEKRAVAREEISLDKDVDVEQRTISDEVRKERVEIDGETDDVLGANDRRP